jgi:hypothetical protein
MFAGAKVKTIGAPSVCDFADVLESILPIKATITKAAAATKTGRSTHNTGKVLDRVRKATFQIVFYTWQNHIFIRQQER